MPGGSIGELLAWTVVIVAVSVLFEKLFMFLLKRFVEKLGMGGALHGRRA